MATNLSERKFETFNELLMCGSDLTLHSSYGLKLDKLTELAAAAEQGGARLTLAYFLREEEMIQLAKAHGSAVAFTVGQST
jgi:hypothetical protein